MRDTREIAEEYKGWMVKTGGYAKDLTLRDYFAAKAMQGYVMDEAILQDSDHSVDWLKKTAAAAYEQADAMLKERNK